MQRQTPNGPGQMPPAMQQQQQQQQQQRRMMGPQHNGTMERFKRDIIAQGRASHGWQIEVQPADRLTYQMQILTGLSKMGGPTRSEEAWNKLHVQVQEVENRFYQTSADKRDYLRQIEGVLNGLRDQAMQRAQMMLQQQQQMGNMGMSGQNLANQPPPRMQPPPFMQQHPLAQQLSQVPQMAQMGGRGPNMPFNPALAQSSTAFQGGLQQHIRQPQGLMPSSNQPQFSQTMQDFNNINPQMLQHLQQMQPPQMPQPHMQPSRMQLQQPQSSHVQSLQNQQANMAQPMTLPQDPAALLTLQEKLMAENQGRKWRMQAEQTGEAEKLNQQIQAMQAERGRQLFADGRDPILTHFVSKAIRTLAQRKLESQQRNKGPQHDLDPNSVAHGQMLGNMGLNQSDMANSAFNPSQFAGQQAEAMRLQAHGDLVVPASVNQPMGGANGFAAQPGLGRPNQGDQALRPGQNGQQPQTGRSTNMASTTGPPTNMSQITSQVQSRATARARGNQQAQQIRGPLQGQVDGLYSMQQANVADAMRTLNQPTILPAAASQAPHQIQPVPAGPSGQAAPPASKSSRVPKANQQRPPNRQQPSQDAPEDQPFPGLDAADVAYLQSLDPITRKKVVDAGQSNWKKVIARLKARPAPNRSQQGIQGSSSAPAQAPIIPPSNRPESGLGEQAFNGMAPQQMNGNAQINNGQGPERPLQEQKRIAPEMLPFPHAQVAQLLPNLPIPPTVKTWGHLRQYFASRPELKNDQTNQLLGRIHKSQMTQFAQKMQASNAAMQGTTDIQKRVAAFQGLVKLTENGLPILVPITNEELAKVRPNLGAVINNVDDERARREFLQKRFEVVRAKDPLLAQEIVNAHRRAQQMQQASHVQNNSGLPPSFQVGPNGLGMVPPFHTGNDHSNHALQPQQGRQQNQMPEMGFAQQGVSVNFSQNSGPSGSMSGQSGNNAPQSQFGHNFQQGRMLEQWTGASEEQRQRMGARQQQQPPPGNLLQHPLKGAVQGFTNNSDMSPEIAQELGLIRQEVHKRLRPEVPLQLSPDDRAEYAIATSKILPDAIKQAQIILVRGYQSKRSTDPQAAARFAQDLCTTLARLQQQKPTAGQFTMPLNEIVQLTRRIGGMFMGMVQGKNPKAAQANTSASSAPATIKEEKSQPVVRSASHRGSKADIPPAAPTSEKPPFAFGATSPHGTPRYATAQLHQEMNLTIPQKRKRKSEQATESAKATPTPQQQALPGQGLTKTTTSVAQQPSPAPPVKIMPYKCAVPHCNTIGSESQDLADTHAKDAHGFDGDAVAWCLTQLRDALNLDRQAQPMKKVAGVEPQLETTGPSDAAAKPAVEPKVEEPQTPAAANVKNATPSNTAPKSNDLAPPKAIAGSKAALTASKLAASARPGSLISKQSIFMKPREVKLSPGESWATSNISRGALCVIFGGLEGFEASVSSLDIFENAPINPVKWDEGHRWLTVQETHERVMREDADRFEARESKDGSPTSVVRIEFDDWDPFPARPGGPCPYAGIDYEIVNVPSIDDPKPLVPMSEDECETITFDAQRCKAILKSEREQEEGE